MTRDGSAPAAGAAASPPALAHPFRALLCAALLAGCASQGPVPTPSGGPSGTGTVAPGTAGSVRIPGVPAPPVDLASLPEPDVRPEPRSRYGNPRDYEVFGRRYAVLPSSPGARERGTASWYGPGFHGERTSSGETFDMFGLTAAHRSLPIPAIARVTNLRNGRSIRVRVNDRGPFVGERVIDLSYAAAWRLDMLREGTAPVEIEVLAVDARVQPEAPLAQRVAGATIAAPAPIAAASAPPPVSTATGPAITTRWLQAGAFGARVGAEALLARLAAAGISNGAIRESAAPARPLYRVHVGPLGDPLEVEDMIERLRLAGVPDARLAHPSSLQ
jgi:rare lipoprotein A